MQEKQSILQAQLDQTKETQKLADKFGKILEDKLNNMHIEHKTINQEVIRETIKEPVYSNCITTPDGVRLIERAINSQ